MPSEMHRDVRPRNLTPLWVSIFIATTVALAMLAAGRVAERRRLEERHSTAARLAAAKMAADFDRHLDQLSADAALLAELLWQTGREPRCPSTDVGTRGVPAIVHARGRGRPERAELDANVASIHDKLLDESVRVLSGAIHHCQGVAFSQNGKDFEIALAPKEDAALGPWLREKGKQAFAAHHTDPRLLGPMEAPGNRPFFIQVQHLPFGLVAAAVDARRLFETLQHGRPADARFLVVDAEETLWAGCASFATCQPITRALWQDDPGMRQFMQRREAPEARSDVPSNLRRILALPATLDVSVQWHPLETDGSPVTLGLVTSLSELQILRRAEHWRILATGCALFLSAGIVGFFLWHQRHRERSLHQSLRHAEELNRLKHQLVRAEKLATVGVLTAGLAHEVGTPLAIIRGRAELLDAKSQLPEAKTILEQADHISNTLRQVLDFSREQPVAVQPIDAMATLRKVVDLLDFRLGRKQLRVHIEGPKSEALWVAADPDRLQQVLVNLVINACDACATGGRIRLSAQPDPAHPDQVRLEIADDGCGIPAAQLDAIFDPFFTTKPKGEGTGLGLPVAASIVRNHQGQISISSVEGKGTTATVLWPAVRGPVT